CWLSCCCCFSTSAFNALISLSRLLCAKAGAVAARPTAASAINKACRFMGGSSSLSQVGRPRRTGGQHHALVTVVDDFGRREIKRQQCRQQTYVAARGVQAGHAGPFTRREQEKGDPQGQENKLQRACGAQRADPHVEGEYAPHEEIPADER